LNETLKIPGHLEAEQHASSNPKQSAWVSANAGAGKTHVLTQRVIRLMLEGGDPSRILCLTYTKSAAAEMKQRIFKTLSSWTMLDEKALQEAISKISGANASPSQMARARSLFAAALDTPGGLKIQTIHAFCEALLHQFPLEANVPGHFQPLVDHAKDALLAEARRWVLGEAVNDDPKIADYHVFLINEVSDDAVDKGLAGIIEKRHSFISWVEENGSLEQAVDSLLPTFGLTPESTQASLFDHAANQLKQLVSASGNLIQDLSNSTSTVAKNAAQALYRFMESEGSNETFESVYGGFYTSKDEIRKNVEKLFAKTHGLEAFCNRLGDISAAYASQIKALKRQQLNHALFAIGYRLIERYEALKRAQGFVDYEDMIHKVSILLNRTEISDWIRYRLDKGIDHLLLDEAQDTSPAQWQIIDALSDDFFSGESASQRPRTLFVVGDEKQSIYSFQGARPEELSQRRRAYLKTVGESGRALHEGRLGMSFRSASDILHAVDAVFDRKEARQGVTQDDTWRDHDAVKASKLGEVQVWPLLQAQSKETVEDWFDAPGSTPAGGTKDAHPEELLAERIALTIHHRVGSTSPGNDKPLTYGDFLVLVRNRGNFVKAFNRAMKGKAIEVAGADRLTLVDHIAVQDLLSIARAALVPDDDFSLASALKTIPFDLSEDDLYDLAHNRGNTPLFDRLGKSDKHRHLMERYETLRGLTTRTRTFEFFATLLGPMGGRKAFMARLGPEAEDVLDAFMEEALNFEENGGAGLQTFVHDLEVNMPELKREAEVERDEVRIMTVHGAKGLEARVVFLVDSNSDPFAPKKRPKLLRVPVSDRKWDGFVWLPADRYHCRQTRALMAELESAAWEEYRRLLYVGMTRAEEELIVCGTLPATGKTEGKWHTLVDEALGAHKEDARVHWQLNKNETPPYRWRSEKNRARTLEPTKAGVAKANASSCQKIPDWLSAPLPAEPALPEPLTPSGAHALIAAEESVDGQMKGPEPARASGVSALEFGNAVHRLLEILPDVSHSEHENLTDRYLQQIGSHWPEEARENAKHNVLNIVSAHPFEYFYGEGSRAEVPIVGMLETVRGTMRISGTVDRLIITPDRVIILDYKTNRSIPSLPDETPDAYVTQLALYRYLLASIYGDRPVEAGLLWTRGPNYMGIPDELLDERLAAIKNA